MTDKTDIHIHLTPQPGITVHIVVAGDSVMVTSENAAPAGAIADTVASPGNMLEGAIQRLESSGSSPNVRAAADGLRDLGYDLKPATTTVRDKLPENYVRFIDPKSPASAVGYLTPTYFGFARAGDRQRLADLTGHQLLAAMVKFSHIDSVEPGLHAAKLLKS